MRWAFKLLGHLGRPGFHGPSVVLGLQKNGLKLGHDLGQKGKA